MTNTVLRSLREAGVILDSVLPFARAKVAQDLAERLTATDPEWPRAVMVLNEAINTGTYWVVSEADAQRLEARGYLRFHRKDDGLPLAEHDDEMSPR